MLRHIFDLLDNFAESKNKHRHAIWHLQIMLLIECSLCQFKNESEIEVYEHIVIEHLNTYQYRYDFCSAKFKIERHLIEQILEKHGWIRLNQRLRS